jgi:hypothetical protein
MYTQENVQRQKISEVLAIVAMALVLIYIADAGVGQDLTKFQNGYYVKICKFNTITTNKSIDVMGKGLGDSRKHIPPKMNRGLKNALSTKQHEILVLEILGRRTRNRIFSTLIIFGLPTERAISVDITTKKVPSDTLVIVIVHFVV